MSNEFKEVRFDIYCNGGEIDGLTVKACKYNYLKEARSPCNECLENGMREGSWQPEYYEEEVK